MGYTTHTVTVYLPIREDDAPLSDVALVEKVRAVVVEAVTHWLAGNADARETLADEPDVDASISWASRFRLEKT